MRQINYEQTASQDSDFKVNYFSVENETEFLTTANNCFEIIISPERETIALYENTNGKSIISNSVVGLSNSYSKLSLRKNVHGFHIRLTPNKLKSVSRIPLHELVKSPVELDCIFGKSYSDLLATINDSQSIIRQIRLIELFFKNKIDHNQDIRKPGFLDILSHDNDYLTVNALQNISGLSERGLERYFKNNIGIAPREYLGIERFNHFALTFLCRKSRSQEISLLQQALDSGYYDQSHFIRHCKRYSGLTPDKFFKKYNSALSGTYNF